MEADAENNETAYIVMENDIKTTLLKNIPIQTIPIQQEDIPEHVLTDGLAVFTNSDGNLTISTIQHEEDEEMQEEW